MYAKLNPEDEKIEALYLVNTEAPASDMINMEVELFEAEAETPSTSANTKGYETAIDMTLNKGDKLSDDSTVSGKLWNKMD